MTFNTPSLVQYCRVCGDQNPVDAAFCINCGQALTRATTGPTTYLGVPATRSSTTALAVLVHRIRRHSKMVVIIAVCLASLTAIYGILSPPGAPLLTMPPSEASGSFDIPGSASLQILVDGYLKAMGSKDLAVASVFVATNLWDHERQALLGPEQAARLARIEKVGLQTQGAQYTSDHNPKRGWATGYIQYRDCSFKHIEVEFVSEDGAWKIASLTMTEEQWLSETFKQQACNDTRNVQAPDGCEAFEPPTARDPTGLSGSCRRH